MTVSFCFLRYPFKIQDEEPGELVREGVVILAATLHWESLSAVSREVCEGKKGKIEP